jgi:hypothetical protein
MLYMAAAAALVALPATAQAKGDHQDGDRQRARGTVERTATPPATTTDKALLAEGRGAYAYAGSGGMKITLNGGVIRVTDRSTAAPLVFGVAGLASAVSANGATRVFSGRGIVTLDGSAYRVTVVGRGFKVEVDPTAANAAVGIAQVAGKGRTIIKGGVPVKFSHARRVVLSRGPLHVNLSGHSLWRVGGPANGIVEMTVSNRIRVWDLSPAKDLVVTGINPARVRAKGDGSTIYSGLRDAAVRLTGTAFRMRVESTDVEGTFTPTPGTLARSAFRGFGTFSTGGTPADDRPSSRRTFTRVLIQP